MKKTLKSLCLVLTVLSTSAYAALPTFTLHANGKTILCPNAAVGETGVVNGVTYTKIDLKTKLIINGGDVDATQACTSGVTSMNIWFQNTTFNKDIGHWDTSSVTAMYRLFAFARAFNQDIGDWNTSKVTYTVQMFNLASAFNQDISKWDTSKVANMSGMFVHASAFNQDISKWNTSKVTNMSVMFSNATAFNQDISKWCVSLISTKPSTFDTSSGFAGNNASQPTWGTCPVSNTAPTITSTPVTTATQDVAYSYELNASDADGDALTWSVTAGETLPFWLSLGGFGAVGTPGFSAAEAHSVSMALDANDIPYVLYSDAQNDYKATLMKYDGVAWVSVGTPGFTTGTVSSLTLAFDESNTPYVAYTSMFADQLTLVKYNGTTWENVGSPRSGSFTGIDLALDSSNTPYVAYSANGGTSTVTKYTAGAWVNVGVAGFSTPDAFNISLVLDSSDTPYITYIDNGNDDVILMKYNGTAWDLVLSRYGYGVSLAFDSSDTPYVAYADLSNQGKATLEKYNGAVWENVGTPGFSTGSANGISLAIDASDTPYVAYADGGNEGQATLMKYNGATWESAGTLGFSIGKIFGSIPLTLDSKGIPYVAYTDLENDGKATLLKLQEGILGGTPTNADVGVHDINLTLSDGENNVTHNFQITVANVNDAPTSKDVSFTMDEDTSKTFASNDFNFTDVDVGDTLNAIFITTLPSAGTLTLNDVNVTLNQEIVNIANLKFTPVANAFGTPYATFGFKVNDGEANSTSAYTATINVTDVAEDIDGDGIQDDIDPNLNDGPLADYDNDGILNQDDPDDDNDGYNDGVDDFPFDKSEWLDTDGDGTGNNADADDDGDGIYDSDEIKWGFDPLDASDGGENDTDGDGVSNQEEIASGSDPLDANDTKRIKLYLPIVLDGVTSIVPLIETVR